VNFQTLSRFALLPFLLTCCTGPKAVDAEPSEKAEACSDGSCTKRPAAPTKDDDVPAGVNVPVEGLPSFGNPHALVTIVAFTDYECSYCARADATIGTLRREYGDRVRVVVASHPLPLHERATPAAQAFLAAAEQGKGEAMHAKLFGGRIDTDDALRAAAIDVGVDLSAFDRSRTSTAPAALARAMELGARLGVTGTPTFFVNGRRIVGARPIETFRALVDEELTKAEALVKNGVAPSRVYGALVGALPAYRAKVEEPKDEIRDVPLGNAPLRGARGHASPVTVVLFSDFECPYCVKVEGTLRELEARGDVRVAFRHRPLPMHSHARLAAKAAIAADRQGRFWPFHDVVVTHRDALEKTDLERYAAEAGLDVARFLRDIDDLAVEARLAEDEKLASELDVKGTPTAFVDGQRVTGAQPLATFQNAIAAASGRRSRAVQ
jgi:protein-disulfide isomerase